MEATLRPWGDYVPTISEQKPWEWCDQHLYLKDSPMGSRFRSDLTPWLKLPMESYASTESIEDTCQCCVQGAKTTMSLGCMLWAAACDPGPALYYAQTDPDADFMALERFMPALNRLGIGGQLTIPDDRSKKTMNYVSLPAGFIVLAGANKNNLQSKTARRINCDELYLWKQGFLKEAKKRCTKYWNKKIFKVSTAGNVGEDLDKEFEAGTKEEWHLGCPSCKELSLPILARLKWDNEGSKRDDGTYDLGELMKSVRYECEHCLSRFIHTSEFSKIANDLGGYIRTNFKNAPRCRSFRWNALCLPPHEVSHAQLVVEFVLAKIDSDKGNDLALKEFFQKRMAESWNPQKFSVTRLLPTADPGEWKDEAYRFMTVDVQQNSFWVVVRAWSKNGASRGLYAGHLMTWEELDAKQAEYKVKSEVVFVDSSFNTHEVESECAKRNRVLTINGRPDWCGWKSLNGEESARKSFIYRPAKGKPSVLPYSWPPTYVKASVGQAAEEGKYCKRHLWSNAAIKDILIKLRDGHGATWLGVVGNEEWNKQMFSERKVKVYNAKGQPKDLWEVIGRALNHLWDCEAEQVVAACMAGILGSGLPEIEDVKEEEAVAA